MKFISSSYDPETKVSTVIMQHFGKKFIGTAKMSAEDPTPASEFTGCRYAELKATIKGLKYERKIAKEKADAALDFIKSCSCYKDFNKEDPAIAPLYKQLNKRIQRVNDITDEINSLMDYYDYEKTRRKVFYEKIDKLKTNADNL